MFFLAPFLWALSLRRVAVAEVSILLEERNGRAIQREEVRLDDMRHKIEVLKLQQEKIKKESK